MNFELIKLQESEFDNDDFNNKIKLGDFDFYYVLCDKKPYLKVEVDTKSHFDNAIIYNNHLLIGISDNVYFINLSNFTIRKIDVEMYFGDFEVSKETIFIFDGNGIIAFNKNLDEIWRNHKLAIDGVIFQEMLNDDIMSIDCEMDPPGGWINRKINIKTGEIVNFII